MLHSGNLYLTWGLGIIVYMKKREKKTLTASSFIWAIFAIIFSITLPTMMDTAAIITLKLSMLTSGTAGRATYLIRIILAIIVTVTLPGLLYAPPILTGELCWTTSFVSCKWERIKLASRNFFSNDMRRHIQWKRRET